MLSSKKFAEQKQLLEATAKKLAVAQKQISALKNERTTLRSEKKWLQDSLSSEMDLYVNIKDEHKHLTKLNHWKSAVHARMVGKYDEQMRENRDLQLTNNKLTKMVLVSVSTALLQRHWRQKTVKNLHDRLNSMKSMHSDSLTEFQLQCRATTPASPIHTLRGPHGSRPGSQHSRRHSRHVSPTAKHRTTHAASPSPSSFPSAAAQKEKQEHSRDGEEPSPLLSGWGFSPSPEMETQPAAEHVSEEKQAGREARRKGVKFDTATREVSVSVGLVWEVGLNGSFVAYSHTHLYTYTYIHASTYT
jgi:hypothetical protein